MAERRCGTCKWWERSCADIAYCVFPISVGKIPFWAATFNRTLSTEGTRCDTWKEREE